MADGPYKVTDVSQTPNTYEYCTGDTRRVLTSVVERETTQTNS